MRSARPKVLHELAGRSMLAHTLSAVLEGAGGDVVVVVGPDRDSVAAEALKVAPGAKIVVQLRAAAAQPTPSLRRAGRLRRATTTFSSLTPIFR